VAELKSALITGGSSGIGFGIAKALLEDGYGVTVAGRRREKLTQAVATLDPYGEVNSQVADLRMDDDIEAMVESHRRRFKGLDVLVNNAGVALGGRFEETDTKSIDLALAVNLRGSLLTTRACMAMLLDAAPSHILNIASFAGLHGERGMTAYSASKGGLIAFTDSLRAEFADRGVKPSAICPGFVDTAMSEVVRPYLDDSDLIPVADVVAVVMMLLKLSPATVVPTLAIEPRRGGLVGWDAAMDRALESG
jgi:NAD(P)-dependent dehydrogenase (short-subunit alcohol dehydrogenase family)